MTITPVTGQANTGTIHATSIPVTLASGVTLGNLLIAALTNVNPVPFSGPARWAQAGPTPAGNEDVQIFYLVVGASDAGATSFTFTMSPVHSTAWLIREWNSTTGWQASPVDASQSSNSASSATVSTGTTGTTAQASELAVAVLSWAGTGTESGLTSGYTSGLLSYNSGGPVSVREAYQILTTTGTQACQETITAAQNAGVIATFKPVAGAATVLPAPSGYGIRARLPGQQGEQIQRPGLVYANSVQQVP